MEISVENIKDEMRGEREKLESEQQKRDEFLKPLLDNFCAIIRNRMYSIPLEVELETYIEKDTIGRAMETTGNCLRNIVSEVTDSIVAENNYINMEDFVEQAFYLSCAVELERKKIHEREVQEQEKLQELNDLECAKPLFEMLKNEVLKWDEDFDEYTITIYVEKMLEFARKHKVDLGIKGSSESESESESKSESESESESKSESESESKSESE